MRFFSAKTNLSLGALVLFFLLICGTAILSPFSVLKFAQAVTGRYNRIASDSTITVDDWNKLDDDFLFRDGSNTMLGDLNMDNHRMTNVTTTADPKDGANVQYVTDAIAAAGAAGGGDVFTNWGGSDCPAGTNKLYSGYAFSARYDSFSGGDNPVCMQSGSPGSAFSGLYADEMYPLVTGQADSLPPAYAGDKIIQCALCHKPQGTCFEYVGRQDCGTSGFAVAYKGYLLGSDANMDAAAGLHHNSTERLCVNDNFNAGVSAGGNLGALWYGVIIENNFSLNTYAENSFLMCSVCCN